MSDPYIAGVGMSRFEKPGRKAGDYPDWVREAVTAALVDAGIVYEDVERAYAGYVYGESTSGQRALYPLGMTGIPIVNVNNNCATGSTALWLACESVRSGQVDIALAVGFEKMQPGSLGTVFADRTNPLDHHVQLSHAFAGSEGAPFAVELFGNAGREHMHRYGSTPEHFAWIAWKNHRHSVHNPYAQFQREYSMEEILQSPNIYAPLTKLQCSPTSDGAACAVVMSERFIESHGLRGHAVRVSGQSMNTDASAALAVNAGPIGIVGADMSRNAALAAYEQSGIGPSDIDVSEVHDCFSTNELLTYEALGFARLGEGHLLVDAEATTYGGRGPIVNPSGGLISKGHPLGATGLAQCAELTWQLRGEAGARQVSDACWALQHNIGLGGAAVVTIYRGPAD